MLPPICLSSSSATSKYALHTDLPSLYPPLLQSPHRSRTGPGQSLPDQSSFQSTIRSFFKCGSNLLFAYAHQFREPFHLCPMLVSFRIDETLESFEGLQPSIHTNRSSEPDVTLVPYRLHTVSVQVERDLLVETQFLTFVLIPFHTYRL